MALENTDLLIVQRPATEVHYKLEVGELGSSVSIAEDAPGDAKAGDLYWDTGEGTLFIYYSGVWVPATPVPTQPDEIDGGVYAP